MKRYLLFAGVCYYPRGGWKDIQGSFETFAEASGAACALMAPDEDGCTSFDWYHIIDSQTGTQLERD